MLQNHNTFSRTSIRLLSFRLEALCVFRNLLNDPVIDALCDYMRVFDAKEISDKEMASKYSEFVFRLYNSGFDCLSKYILSLTLNDQNVIVNAASKGIKPCDEIRISSRNDIETLQMVADLTCESLCEGLSSMYFLPKFKFEQVDILHEYRTKITDF